VTEHRRARPARRPSPSVYRALCVLTIGVAMTVPVSLPAGSADELDARKHKVERRIEQAEKDLHHSSTRLAGAVKRLDGAVRALRRARAALVRARGDLAEAEALDRSTQAALEEAVEEEKRAREALADGQAAVTERRQELRAVAVQMHAAGGAGLMALSAVFRSKEPAQVTGKLSMRRTLLEREAAAVSRLDASAVMLAVREAAFHAATQEAARRRTAAAESLERKERSEDRARAARGRVLELVNRRREARREAAAAKAQDLARLRQFRKERERISAQLRRRAAKARGGGLGGSRGASRAPGVLMRPVQGYITSRYGMRLHPVYKRWALHDGTDFGAGCGTPIRAARSGTVVGSYYDRAYGKRVIIDHGWLRGAGLGTSYNHLVRASVRVGERVQRGEVIGRVGSTGYSTGCHLHFMVFRNGATVNPMGWL
jgi:murein DD-endopeptidase MepM/ murein hydrolase activator NlpD